MRGQQDPNFLPYSQSAMVLEAMRLAGELA
jgi:hypothetical protein